MLFTYFIIGCLLATFRVNLFTNFESENEMAGRWCITATFWPVYLVIFLFKIVLIWPFKIVRSIIGDLHNEVFSKRNN